ncbi:MAG: glycosyltransferase, partial [Chthoniobacteraceae bacterium]|nr:glycosyltransferase [Chthoniobacteraceae bacterium]
MNSEKTKYWLSICIPTFNRSQYLRLTLESITNQELFQNSDEIEIVISDNCSSDD